MRFARSDSRRPRYIVMTSIMDWTEVVKLSLYILLIGTFICLFPQFGEAKGQVIGIDQHKKTLKVKAGRVFKIELPGNAGTGFEWQFDALDKQVFELMGSEMEIAKEGDPKFVGNSYLQSWTIKALKAGRSTLRLLYYRSWEGKSMAEETFQIEVTVHP